MADLLTQIEANQRRDNSRFDQIASFEVLKAWIEPELPVARTKSRFKSRGYPLLFTVGDTYLIVVGDLEYGFYWIESICTDSIPAADATEHIEALDDLTPLP